MKNSVRTVVRTACIPSQLLKSDFSVYQYDGCAGDVPCRYTALVRGAVEGERAVPLQVHAGCPAGSIFSRAGCLGARRLGDVTAMMTRRGSGIIVATPPREDILPVSTAACAVFDEREAGAVSGILADLGVRSVALVEADRHHRDLLKSLGICVVAPAPQEEPAPAAARRRGTVSVRVRTESGGSEVITLDRAAVSTRCLKPARLHRFREMQAAMPELPRPFVTLCYAQSIDGCIAGPRGSRVMISGRESLEFVHEMRAHHDAILVGIGTVVNDDPHLTVRFVRGRNPRPVVLDTNLRFPLQAHLLRGGPVKPWIVAGETASMERQTLLENEGAKVIRVPLGARGHLSVPHLLKELRWMGVRSLLVEGGARVIAGFLSDRIVDLLAVTVAPVYFGDGVPVLGTVSGGGTCRLPRLGDVSYHWLGKDVVVQGVPQWSRR